MEDLTPMSLPRLVAIPRLAAGGRWRVEAMRAYSEPLMLWFTKGQGRVTISGVTRGYTAHNAIIYHPPFFRRSTGRKLVNIFHFKKKF